MDVSGRDKKKLKSGAPNFEKQKNESILKFMFFFEYFNILDHIWHHLRYMAPW